MLARPISSERFRELIGRELRDGATPLLGRLGDRVYLVGDEDTVIAVLWVKAARRGGR